MLSTLHLYGSNPADVVLAAQLLRSGKLVAFATETVYGLGANAFSLSAVAEIFIAKRRPLWDPLIVHLASAQALSTVAHIPVALASRVAALTTAFWPGPLTLLLPRSPVIPDAVTAGRALVGVRVPAHPAAQALLLAAGLPIAAPSANLFGHTSPTSAAHVLADLDGRIAAVLDDGATTIGLESTVLDPTQTPMIIYRPGAVTAAQLEAVTGVAVQVFIPPIQSGSTAPQSLPSPGTGIRHYAPRARLLLSGDTPEALGELLRSNRQAGLTGVLLPTDWTPPEAAIVQAWARWDDPQALASTLFAGLRALDETGVSLILCPLPAPGGLADAIRDRLGKAARAA